MKEYILTEDSLKWLEKTKDFSRIEFEELIRCEECLYFQEDISIDEMSPRSFCTREIQTERRNTDFCSKAIRREIIEKISDQTISEEKVEEKTMDRDLNGLKGTIDRISVDEENNKICTVEFTDENGDIFFENISSKQYKMPKNIKDGDIIKIKKFKVSVLKEETDAEKQDIIDLQNKLFG